MSGITVFLSQQLHREINTEYQRAAGGDLYSLDIIEK